LTKVAGINRVQSLDKCPSCPIEAEDEGSTFELTKNEKKSEMCELSLDLKHAKRKKVLPA
jgi:hypothetical protein